MRNHPKNCHRCADDLRVSTMSKFNRDIICIPCKKDEKDAPGYKAACDTEIQAVRNGDYNFPGVGLSADDSAFLFKRLRERKNHALFVSLTEDDGDAAYNPDELMGA